MLTLTGIKSLGAPADLVAVAIPADGSPVPLGTLPAQRDGPYSLSATVPPGSYTVQATTGTTLSSDSTATYTVAPATLVATGSNSLGYPATITLTATPDGGGSPIPIGILTGQPVGPFAVIASLPPGDYTIHTAMTAAITSEVQSSASVAPTLLTVAGTNTLGVPADIVVTATPSGAGNTIVTTLANQPPRPSGWSHSHPHIRAIEPAEVSGGAGTAHRAASALHALRLVALRAMLDAPACPRHISAGCPLPASSLIIACATPRRRTGPIIPFSASLPGSG